jgi:hypothetical protein
VVARPFCKMTELRHVRAGQEAAHGSIARVRAGGGAEASHTGGARGTKLCTGAHAGRSWLDRLV